MNGDPNSKCGQVPMCRDVYAIALLFLALVLAAGFFSMTWRTGDDARYIGLARSLLSGHGYTMAYLPHDPPETITPPAQPLAIALVTKIGGGGVLPGKLFSSFMFVIGSLLVYAWAKIRLDDRFLAFCCAIMGQFTFGILTMSCWYMVEMHFIAASFLVLLLALYEERSTGIGWALMMGLAAGYVYLIRATGLSFAAAGGAYFLLVRRDWKKLLLFTVGFLAFAGPWMVRTYLVTGATEAYVSFQTNLVGATDGYPWLRIPKDIAHAFPVYFIQAMPDALFYRLMGEFGLLGKLGLGFLEPVARWGILALISIGFISRLRQRRVAELYWIFYWLIITAPPFPPQGHWYVYPLLPMAALYIIDALRIVSARLSADRRVATVRWAAGACAVYVLTTALTGAAVQSAKEHARRHLAPWAPERYFTYKNEYMDAWARFVEAGLWISTNYPPTTLVVSRQPSHLYLLTGLEGWRYDLPEVPGRDLYERMSTQSTNRQVVLVEDAFVMYSGASFSYGSGHWALKDLFEKHASELELVHECGPPSTRVWQFRPDVNGSGGK